MPLLRLPLSLAYETCKHAAVSEIQHPESGEDTATVHYTRISSTSIVFEATMT